MKLEDYLATAAIVAIGFIAMYATLRPHVAQAATTNDDVHIPSPDILPAELAVVATADPRYFYYFNQTNVDVSTSPVAAGGAQIEQSVATNPDSVFVSGINTLLSQIAGSVRDNAINLASALPRIA